MTWLFFLPGYFCVSDASDISLRDEQRFLFGAVERGGINGAGQISEKHPVSLEIESDPDSLHQMREQNVGGGVPAEIGVRRRAVHGVSTRRISAVRPIDEPIL